MSEEVEIEVVVPGSTIKQVVIEEEQVIADGPDSGDTIYTIPGHVSSEIAARIRESVTEIPPQNDLDIRRISAEEQLKKELERRAKILKSKQTKKNTMRFVVKSLETVESGGKTLKSILQSKEFLGTAEKLLILFVGELFHRGHHLYGLGIVVLACVLWLIKVKFGKSGVVIQTIRKPVKDVKQSLTRMTKTEYWE